MHRQNNIDKEDVIGIPENWESKTLEELTHKIGDGIHSTPKYDSSGEYFFVNGNNLENGRIIVYPETKRVNKDEFIKHKRHLHESTILLSINGTIGNVAYYNNEKVVLGKSAAYINLKSKISKDFFFYFIQTDKVQNYFSDEITGTTINNLGLNSIRKTPILFPPLPEQKAIAEVLSDTDKLIQSLEKQIAKKRLIKQGVMQELLRPKAGWEEKKLEAVGEIITGSTPPTQVQEYWNGSTPWITPTDIKSNMNISTSERLISSKGLKISRKLPKDSLLITCIASIGKNAILRCPGSCNQQINAIVPNKEFNVEFLYYLLEMNRSVLIENAGITATLILSKKAFSQLKFTFPNKTVQNNIAEILSDLDYEIEAIKKKRNKFQSIKQALMQNLLSGKIRLKS